MKLQHNSSGDSSEDLISLIIAVRRERLKEEEEEEREGEAEERKRERRDRGSCV